MAWPFEEKNIPSGRGQGFLFPAKEKLMNVPSAFFGKIKVNLQSVNSHLTKSSLFTDALI